MDRRDFIRVATAGLACLPFGDRLLLAQAREKNGRNMSYSVVILGDTHFDTAPDTVYHTGYSDPNPTREANHRKEFGRNAEMWQSRLPRLVKRASCLIDEETKVALQMGDLIQGDTGSKETHIKFLDDAYSYLKVAMGPLPLVTVAGNHDLRSWDDKQSTEAYTEYMTAKMSSELGKEITKTTFSFMVGPDAFIVVDFTHPDDEELDRIFKETEGARYTFFMVHGPLFPSQSTKAYDWILHGRDGRDDLRRHVREVLAKRNAIVLCGHTHTTEFIDWYGDGGRISQITMNSVWTSEERGNYTVVTEDPADYGKIATTGPKATPKAIALFDEYKSGIKVFSYSTTAGCYKLNVSKNEVTLDIYGGDSTFKSGSFKVR
jgi:Calcineurin-like phosphoesterase.